jgi:hypothetical protein
VEDVGLLALAKQQCWTPDTNISRVRHLEKHIQAPNRR